MRALLPCFALLVLSACPRGTPPSAAAAAPDAAIAAASEDDCTISTPLVAGVPGSPGNLLPSELNPNGDSELAALMRIMQKDLAASRDALTRGERSGALYARHRKMRCAWPTDPAERTPAFDALAQAYLSQVKALDTAPTAQARAAHDAVVTACIACHETTCRGPIDAIKTLALPSP